MSVKAERGTKRTCQNGQCGARFYDLNRDPATCPICGTANDLSAAPAVMAAAAPSRAPDPRKAPKKPVFPVDKPEDVPEAEGEADEALVVLEDEAAAPGDEDETFLEEEEEDSGDVSNIIGGPVAEGEEPA